MLLCCACVTCCAAAVAAASTLFNTALTRSYILIQLLLAEATNLTWPRDLLTFIKRTLISLHAAV